MSKNVNLQNVVDTITIFRSEGDVTEVRILNTKEKTVNGYFNDPIKLAKAIDQYIGKYDIYFTLNPVKKDLLARANNRLQTYTKKTTSDIDIENIDYILIDIDAIRSAGISSTKKERANAKKLAKQIMAYLMELGFPEPVFCDSGNGYHVIVPVNLENTDGNVTLVKNILNVLDLRFSNDYAQVDRTTFNPSRITKLYGTMAVKGDNTEDRPHRWSKVIISPKLLKSASKKRLLMIADQLPNLTETKAPRGKSYPQFDIDSWIEEKGLKVSYSASFHNKGTKFILETCPWNPEHTNFSSYIIKFDDGGFAAGCLHNGCHGHNWEKLRDLLEPDWRKSIRTSDDKEDEKQSDIILKLAEGSQFLTNELEEPYVAVENGDHIEVISIKSSRIKLYLIKLYFEEIGSAPSSEAMNEALKVMEMKAIFSGNEIKLQRRIAQYNNDTYYDLGGKDWQAVVVTKAGCSVENKPPILFTRNKNMKEQVLPDFNTKPVELLKLVKKHFRFKQTDDLVLFAVYIVCCFLTSIAHVILVLHGEKGSAKSTTMKMVKRIVDPAIQELLSMPTSKQDLAIVLANTYMPCFDNLDSLSPEKSDMLCMAATGGAFSKRMLFSDSDETILTLKRCVGVNGINVVAIRPDLLDRSVVLELKRISKIRRKTDAEVWRDFESDLPRFLGAIMNALSHAMTIIDTVKLQEVGRMADFTYWGFAIAEVTGIGGNNFLKAYLNNQDRANHEAIESHPVAAAVVALMRKYPRWIGSVSKLLKALVTTAFDESIDIRVKNWPKDAHVLSMRLKEVKSNLEEIDIFYCIRHAGTHKEILIENKAFNISGVPLYIPKKRSRSDKKKAIRDKAMKRQKRESEMELAPIGQAEKK